MTLKGYVLILAVHVNPTARNEQDNPRHLHCVSSEPAMASGEPSATTNAGMAFRTTPDQIEHIEMKYRLS